MLKSEILTPALLLDLDNALYPYDVRHEVAIKKVREKAARLPAIAPSGFDQLFDRARGEVKAPLGAGLLGRLAFVFGRWWLHGLFSRGGSKARLTLRIWLILS